MDRGPKALYAGDAGAPGAIKPLLPVDRAHYVLDPSKPGTMTKSSKFAYAAAPRPTPRRHREAAAKAGAKVVDFNTALTSAYLGMAEDTVMLRKRRGEMRKKLNGHEAALKARCWPCRHPAGCCCHPVNRPFHRARWLVLAWCGAGLAALRPGRPVKLPAPGPRDTCPVCGMFVAPYPYWVATVLWRDGKAVHFDGAKDFFKYLLDLKKYEPRRSRADIQAMGVTDYYGTGAHRQRRARLT
jgi:nitrous oxide reductase accessory protein NosL